MHGRSREDDVQVSDVVAAAVLLTAAIAKNNAPACAALLCLIERNTCSLPRAGGVRPRPPSATSPVRFEPRVEPDHSVFLLEARAARRPLPRGLPECRRRECHQSALGAVRAALRQGPPSPRSWRRRTTRLAQLRNRGLLRGRAGDCTAKADRRRSRLTPADSAVRVRRSSTMLGAWPTRRRRRRRRGSELVNRTRCPASRRPRRCRRVGFEASVPLRQRDPKHPGLSPLSVARFDEPCGRHTVLSAHGQPLAIWDSRRQSPSSVRLKGPEAEIALDADAELGIHHRAGRAGCRDQRPARIPDGGRSTIQGR